MRHPRHGPPRRVVGAAVAALADAGLAVEAVSPVIESAPLGPSHRRYANAAARVATGLGPEALLDVLQGIESEFGRKRRGQRWGARVLDLDIVLWTGGPWASETLILPHPEFRRRAFVLGPAAAVAPGWRDSLTGRTVRHLQARLTRPTPLA